MKCPPLVMTLDADTLLEPTAIERIVFAYLSHKQCVVVGGSIYVLNDNQFEHGRLLTKNISKKFVPALQAIEYLRSFSYGRAGLNSISGALCYPGAFTLFETKMIKDLGGFDSTNFSYDAEIIIKFHHRMRQFHYPTHMRFSSNALSWTNVPSTFSRFWEQRNRWQRGMLLSGFKHMAMFFNPKYGVVGLVTFPAYMIFEVFGPVIEFISYILLTLSFFASVVSWNVIGWYVLLAWGYLTLLTIATFYLNSLTYNIFPRFSQLLRVIWLITAEMFGFRQFKAACCFFSTLQFFYNRVLGRNL